MFIIIIIGIKIIATIISNKIKTTGIESGIQIINTGSRRLSNSSKARVHKKIIHNMRVKMHQTLKRFNKLTLPKYHFNLSLILGICSKKAVFKAFNELAFFHF